jgi:nitroreductase
MDTLEALRTRRSIAKLKPDEIPRELIEQILETALWAPNHKRLEPWKFFVFSGAGREKLAAAFVENYRRDHPDASDEELQTKARKSADRVLVAPATIVVTSDAHEDNVLDLENFAATAAAVEHILLAAHALGLGAYWRTGDAAYTAPRNAVKELIGVDESTRLVAFVILGYPDMESKEGRRAPLAEKTTWFDK